MSWYSSKEDAAEAVKQKEKEYGCEFHVLEENTPLTSKSQPGETIWWAQRKIKK